MICNYSLLVLIFISVCGTVGIGSIFPTRICGLQNLGVLLSHLRSDAVGERSQRSVAAACGQQQTADRFGGYLERIKGRKLSIAPWWYAEIQYIQQWGQSAGKRRSRPKLRCTPKGTRTTWILKGSV